MTVNHWISISVGILLLLLLDSNGDQLMSDQAWRTENEESYALSQKEASGRELRVIEDNKGLEIYSLDVYACLDQFDSSLQNQLSYFNRKKEGDNCQFVPSAEIPNKIDFRTEGCVTSVDDQGQCGACWAFVVAGAVEALMARTTGKLEKLSTQQIIDCNTRGDDCVEGSSTHAMLYAKSKGLQLDCTYTYVAEKQACRFDENKVAFTFRKFCYDKHTSEARLEVLVARTGPIITHITVTHSFYDYRVGIYSTSECKPELAINHAVLIVGYGFDDEYDEYAGKDYWLIKNSHGTDWGEEGYMRFERNIGMCKIGSSNIRPVAS